MSAISINDEHVDTDYVIIIMSLQTLYCPMQYATICYYPVHICTAGLCVWSRWFVYARISIFVYICQQKNRLFSALLLKNFLLSVICCWLFEFKCLQCGLLHPASSTDRAIWFGRIGLCIYVYVNLYNIMSTKSRLFSALLLKNL